MNSSAVEIKSRDDDRSYSSDTREHRKRPATRLFHWCFQASTERGFFLMWGVLSYVGTVAQGSRQVALKP